MTEPIEVLYISSAPTPDEFARMRASERSGVQVVTYGMPEASFKFHNLIQRGLVEQGCRVHSLVGRSITRQFHRGVWWPRRRGAASDRLTVDHLPFPNLPVLRQVWIALGMARGTLAWRWRTRRAATRVLVVDGSYVSAMSSVLPCLRGARMSRIGIFADLYSYMVDVDDASDRTVGTLYRVARRSVTASLGMLDGFVVLTRQMADVLDTGGKPSIVMEGLVDSEAVAPAAGAAGKSPHPTVLYAGALRKEYGLETLVRGFQAWDESSAELIVLGQGEYAAELAEIAARDPRITYRGPVPLDEVLDAERRAWVLINPRPPDEVFTQYSFPSKNMEYLASGTPVLSTRLPGMPAEYLDHVLTIDQPDAPGLATALATAFAEGPEALERRGQRGRAFVVERKNNVRQAARIVALAEEARR
ncbi:Glycosyltransferase involved in cell wall bisynthesis [Nocardioides exalbidus]|uniref:Glycosyltransferase involved in cell wall bisynthesis n=1 Tax=Nocardioides exalbidus TaxID=402596 RepID=A0A1H4MTY7_9ACTN|nr:glycosyltransferase [Nocardioides exalbidus]SEB85985.1 Glycosyltransferase involved in cell wall bisynthesis [Nocardioides exalbidus]